jgi:hypothetical protein
MSSTAFVYLSYDISEPMAPQSLFVKLPSPLESNRRTARMIGGIERENGFYQDIASALPVASPRYFYSASDPATGSFVVVLEKVPDSSHVASFFATRQQVELCLAQLVRLHCATWNSLREGQFPWLRRLDGSDIGAVFDARFRDNWSQQRPHVSALWPGQITKLSEKLVGAGPVMRSALCTPNLVLAHCDTLVQNWVFTGGDPPTGAVLVDWQLPRLATCAIDFGLLVYGSMTPEDRRDSEDELVRSYLEGLSAGGVQGYTSRQFELDRKWTMLWQWRRHLTARALLRNDSSDAEEVRNHQGAVIVAAIMDHEAWTVLDL